MLYWHIDTDIVALFVVCILTVYHVRVRPRLVGPSSREEQRRDRSFLWCLYTGAGVTVVDIASSLAMELPVGPVVYHILMTLYYLTVETLIVGWVYYSLVILYSEDKHRFQQVGRWMAMPYLLYACLVCSNPWTGLFFTVIDGVYTRGPLFFLMVVLFALYIVALIVLVLVRRRHIPAAYPGWVLLLIPFLEAGAMVVQLLIPGWLLILPCYMVCLVLVFLFLQSVRIQGTQAQVQKLAQLVEHFASGLSVCRVDEAGTLTVDFISRGYAAICGLTPEEMKARFDRDILSGVHPEDRQQVKEHMQHTCDQLRDQHVTYRYLTDEGSVKWIDIQTRAVPEAGGGGMIYSTVTDLTEQKNLQQQLADVINTVPCGICVYRWDGEQLHPLLSNSQYLELLDQDIMAHMESSGGLTYTFVHPEDREPLRQANLQALTQGGTVDFTFRILRDDATQWIRQRGVLIQQPDGVQLAYVTYYDVTQEHLAAQRLRESEQALEYATQQAGLWYWRWDGKRDVAYLDERIQKEHDLPAMLENFTGYWLEQGLVYPEDVPICREACRKLQNGQQQTIFEVRNQISGEGLHWYRCCLTNLYDSEGNVTVTVGTAIRIDTEKELWAKYELEKKRSGREDKNLLAHAVFNLTQDEIIEYAYQDGTASAASAGKTFDYSRDYAAPALIDPEERRYYLEISNRQTLLERFAKGETEAQVDCRRQLRDGSVSWVRNTYHTVRDPRSSDILLFEYWYDIEEEKMQELMYHSLATDNFDYVARINGLTGHYMLSPKEGLTYLMPPTRGEDADAVTRFICESGVVPEDRELVLHNNLVENILDNLSRQSRFQFTYREQEADGSLRHKRITQYYLDPQRKIILMTREDVTALIQAEAEKNQLLGQALDAANQASRAKSQFLSRVSHELRTPMNAIIGLSALAAGEVHDPTAMEHAIAKIGLSARYLLSLINDILEMSRIESGRMTLNEGPFGLEELVAAVNNIIYSQATAKGLDYDAMIKGGLEPAYLGDMTKLQQILVNVLGNAVKFTPAGGKISLSLEQLSRSGDRATLRFQVSDTGIGIEPEFLPHLFDAFSQEAGDFTATTTGTGLGLAITKNMVELMSGHIEVQSIKGVGSVFTIDVQVRVTEDSRRYQELIANMNLSRMKVLLVDDDVTVCQTTTQVLTDMGLTAEWVDNGWQAVERVAQVHKDKADFDAIFIDWKMPQLDGVETARRIRRIVGPEVTIIIITSYDWRAIENDARAAGVDLFLDKPLFQSSFVLAFERILAARSPQPTPRRPVTAGYDFHGRHILLVEDHPLNVEVAKRLLQKVGAEVTVANNGLEAIEAFTTAPDGQYDAILMDVRMPVMDGLTATRNIRALKKSGSQTIPIVAVTANAFDEDVEQSLSSGMNAHLSKPIDPRALFATLQRLMEKPQKKETEE